ncbi:MAG: uroporphyrinogen-III C-methyltransferase [Pseudomonadota bacterium]
MTNNISHTRHTGTVYLVGAGPGDPDLLTVKAYRLLQRADVVVYDRLINKALLKLAPDNADLIYVGKRKNLHVMSQDQINQTLIDHAAQGLCVVRLKGGDPFVFGRGGEEMDALNAANIACEIVPGITAAAGAAASIGLPLTHRDFAQSVTLVTAHRQHGKLDLDWNLVTGSHQSVVFYMGLSVMDELVAELLTHALPRNMPVTVVSNATCHNEICITGTLGEICDHPDRQHLNSPALVILHPRPFRESVKDVPNTRKYNEQALLGQVKYGNQLRP